MERPKGEKRLVKREVTGEIVYLDEMRANAARVQEYPDDLDVPEVVRYETVAEAMRQAGQQPAIMAEYERYDDAPSKVKRSCTELAEILHSLQRPDARLTFEDIVVEQAPQQVQDALRTIRAGELLAHDDKQLAFESDGSYYPVLDIQKKDATLHSVSLRVFKWTQNYKGVFTNKKGETYQYPRDYLQYPSNEVSHNYELQLCFGYSHPASSFTETVTLAIGSETDDSLRVSSEVWVAAYAETGYEGHGGKGLKHASDTDYAQLAGLMAEVVGDQPEAYWQREQRLMDDYIATVPDETSREYLREWVENSFAGQVIHTINSTKVGSTNLRRALASGSPEAEKVLADLVNARRERRRQMIEYHQNNANDIWGGGIDGVEPWADRVQRD